MIKEDLTGIEFGNFLVLGHFYNKKIKYCKCLCFCGNSYLIQAGHLKKNTPKSCGCLDKEDLSGRVFNRLYVLHKAGIDKFKKQKFECICTCGNFKIATGDCLRSGNVKSCGCLILDGNNKTHGQSKSSGWSKEYATYRSMLQRCFDKNSPRYVDYGGRGITVSDSWQESFENFFNDIGKKPTPKHSLDRIDNNKGYSIDNCRWVTMREQAGNTRSNVWISYNGVSKIGVDWAREIIQVNRITQCLRKK